MYWNSNDALARFERLCPTRRVRLRGNATFIPVKATMATSTVYISCNGALIEGLGGSRKDYAI